MNWLGKVFLSRSGESLNLIVSLSLNSSGDGRMVYSPLLTSIDLNLFGFSVDSRLNISFSNSQLSWDIYVN